MPDETKVRTWGKENLEGLRKEGMVSWKVDARRLANVPPPHFTRLQTHAHRYGAQLEVSAHTPTHMHTDTQTYTNIETDRHTTLVLNKNRSSMFEKEGFSESFLCSFGFCPLPMTQKATGTL